MLWVDMAHFAGLVAAGLHPSPVPHAHVTSVDRAQDDRRTALGLHPHQRRGLAKKINSNVFPGQQGGPLMHVIAAKATAFKLAAEPEFRTVRSAPSAARRSSPSASTRPTPKAAGVDVLTGGTDVHLVLVDLRTLGAHRQGRRGPSCTRSASR